MHRISESFPVVYRIFVVVIMSAITRAQLVKILDEKLAPFKPTIAELKKSADEANKFAKFTSKQYVDMLMKVEHCEEENKRIKTENVVLRKALESVECWLKSVQKSYNDLEQYGQPPHDHSVLESTNNIAKKVGNLIGVKIEDREISISHRIPNRKSRVSKFKKLGPATTIVNSRGETRRKNPTGLEQS